MKHASKRVVWALSLTGFLAQSAMAANIIDEWDSVRAPQPPEVERVNLDPDTTALLMLDFNRPPCDPQTRPRCAATIPAAQSLLLKAKAAGVYIIYTLGAGGAASDMDQRLLPVGSEPVFPGPPNKFFRTELENLLKSRGIKTIVPMGASSNGSILYTSSEAAFRGYDIVVPVDGVSAATVYAEQFTLWQLRNGPAVSARTKLTRTDLVSFGRAR
jgi:nicotinamidase-related amidase